MRAVRVLALVGGLLLALALLRTESAPSRIETAASASLAHDPAGEVVRLRRHFAIVLEELAARDVSKLDEARRAARARHIAELREYAESGVFPHNHDRPGQWLPYFVDAHGTLCAMALLIERSGRSDLVERVAAQRNNAYMTELAEDPEVVAWLEESGLSLAEAARIQPTYRPPPGPPEPVEISARYATAAVVTSGLGIASVVANLSVDPTFTDEVSMVVGLFGGAFGVGLGLSKIGEGGAATAVAAVTGAIGVTSLGTATWRLTRGGPRPSSSAELGSRASITIAPETTPDGAAGVRVVARF